MWKNVAAAAVVVLCVEGVLALREAGPRAALGQAAAGPSDSALLATVQGQSSEPYVFLYDVASKRLCCYTLKNGIELRGARECTNDLKLRDLMNVSKRISPDDIK